MVVQGWKHARALPLQLLAVREHRGVAWLPRVTIAGRPRVGLLGILEARLLHESRGVVNVVSRLAHMQHVLKVFSDNRWLLLGGLQGGGLDWD